MLHRKSILALTFSNDDKILASGDTEGIIRVWKFQDGKKLREIDTQAGEAGGICTLALTSNNSQLVAGTLDKKLKIYGLKSGNLLKEMKDNESFILQTSFLPGKDNLLVCGYEDG